MSILRAATAAAAALSLSAALVGYGAPAAALPTDDASGRVVLPADVTPDHYDITITPDAKTLSFTGEVKIALTVHAPTDKIVLNDADIVIDRAALSGEAAAPAIAYDAAAQTATFAFGRVLAPGHYALSLAYHGKIYQQASGFFALDYQAQGGAKRALFTQFENSDARRFVPSWDEPGRKATFTLSAVVPADEMALSNMPVAETAPAGDGLVKVRFAETPKMSSYLLFFGLGDFERAHRDVGGVDVGVVVKRGDLASASYALDAASQLLPYYDSYFGKPYPLPKLDLVAGPGSSQFFGAMENWGAIFSFERDMLIDSHVSTEADRQNVYIVVAHEMAHQWFGDLVTMDWWDQLWLNEGFASWMENKASDHFHPEWKLWLQSQNEREAGYQIDARAGTHPIITPIKDVLQAGGAFDDITYLKGAAVIRMLESYLGEDTFRAGVRRYIAGHAYGNTVTDDLWREMDAVSPGRPISQIAHDFTLQAGVPLIAETAAACDGGRERLTLAQDRFAMDEASRKPTAWHVPVTAAVGEADARTVVSGPAGASLDLDRCGPALINAGQTGYYRSLYAPGQMAALTERFAALSAEDQLGLINDTRALAYAGDAPMASYLNLTTKLDAKTDPIIWQRVAGLLVSLDRLYDGGPGQDAYRAYARSVLAPALAGVGWDAKPGEGDNVATMRGEVLTALGELGDPAVAAEAHRRFDSIVADPSGLQGATRESVLNIVARRADAADWDRLHVLARSAPTELQRMEFYGLMGSAEDPALAQKALDLALSGEPAPTTAPEIISSVSVRHPAMALDYATAHWDQIKALLEPDSRATYAPRLVYWGSDAALIAKLDAFAARNIPEDARQEVVKADAAVAYQAKVKTERLPDVDAWLAAQPRPR